MPTILVPTECAPGETRVAAVPETVRRMVKLGHTVLVESGAGAKASISDAQYTEAGATIEKDPVAAYKKADVVLKINPPQHHEGVGKFEADLLKEGTLLVSFLWPFQNEETVKALAARKVITFAMDRVPRITRAQAMDALSSQSNLAGYKAVIIAAEKLPKIFPLMMTAAGTIKPAKVVIMGAGVAGLQAIATAKRLGAVVEVSDVRPAVKEQVESLGGKFIEIETDESMQDAGGYAKEATPEFLKKQQELVRKHIVEADVVITTALIPGKPAPKLVTEDMVQEMHDGSVIVDLATATGGNCELSKDNETVVAHGVIIVGDSNLPGSVPQHASEMYAKNVLNVVEHFHDKEGNRKVDFEDEITAGSVVTCDGQIRIPELAGSPDPTPAPAPAPAPEGGNA
ncbi:Re/Si-specific NAD(P)(+) transhydrogenase subunit alpha [bacterium]|nr:Re/Si-specific NAD(P)(+) transhydrogenase subunit alpha [bacterium]MCB9476895.1 Re/Si-specific NAD(P)(+) transhydrogenase subunit alpha [Deltaproteobacteria bacterium]MCB9480034.1 Re/Si-specific NAD(P)(+) transhydrogenase subunit alpha [Deltaproteobacteria bacterium]